jgi:hypothetical protein
MTAARKGEVDFREAMDTQPANVLCLRLQIKSRKAMIEITVFFL